MSAGPDSSPDSGTDTGRDVDVDAAAQATESARTALDRTIKRMTSAAVPLSLTAEHTRSRVRKAGDILAPLLRHEDPAVQKAAHDVLNELDVPLALVLRLDERLASHRIAVRACRTLLDKLDT